VDRFVDRETELDQLTDCDESDATDFVVMYRRHRLEKSEFARRFRAVGQWWFKEHELDVLGLTDEELVAGECKFTSTP
jgi:AAA+ ATPase superfamily predicted ATPase